VLWRPSGQSLPARHGQGLFPMTIGTPSARQVDFLKKLPGSCGLT
jgi:hypothetical protein